MNINCIDDDLPSASPLDEITSPRKKLRADWSWSLLDRRTDQEMLQEMGVNLLEQDENEGHCEGTTLASHKSGVKRKRDADIENVNPNAHSVSPRRRSPRSPKSKRMGAGTSRSPLSPEAKPLQPTDLETTLLTDYLIEEETPSAQVSAQYMPHGSGFTSGSTSSCSGGKKQSFTSLGLEEELIISRRSKSEPLGGDTFSVLSDEMILSVFRWLPKRTLAHCMLVCKRWYRVACDESLWQRLDLGNKVLSKDALGRILARKPVIVRLASTEIAEWQPASPPTPSRIQFLDLSMCAVEPRTLRHLLERCPALKKLSLENAHLQDDTCRLIGKCTNLETLNLAMCRGITPEGLADILKGCVSLQSLNISWCNLSEAALQLLVSALPQKLQRLNVGGARIMTDDMVAQLCSRCPRLLELDLSDCSRLGAAAVGAALRLARLEHLALSRCYLLPPHVLTKVGSMPSLQYLEVWGMLQAGSLGALRAALPALQVNQFMFSEAHCRSATDFYLGTSDQRLIRRKDSITV